MTKPDLSLYIGKKVVEVLRGDLPWEWALVLEGGVKIINKNRKEVFSPDNAILGFHLSAMSMSSHDTTVHFMNGAEKISIGFAPTQYAILDPRYGGEAYPQWPEELEEAGIPSHPDEEVSAKASPEWLKTREELLAEQDKRHMQATQDFLAADLQEEEQS